MKKVLILAYDFPPYVSVGGLRPYSWYKYMKEFGLHPVVVTRQWGNKYGNHLDYIAPGESAETIVEETEFGTIIRTPYKPNLSNRLLLKHGESKFKILRKAITASYEFVQFLYVTGPKKELYKTAKDYLNHNKVDAIIATADPFVLFSFADKLSKKYGIPWIADYRDPWSQDIGIQDIFIIRKWNEYLEKKILRSATCVSTVSTFVKVKINTLLNKEAFHVLQNGFDPELIDEAVDIKANQDSLNIAFAGTIYEWHPWKSFISIYCQFTLQNPAVKSNVNFYGVNEEERIHDFIQENYPKTIDNFSFTPRLPNREVLKELAKNNVMLLFNDYSFLGTKIFDYLGIKRKVIFCYSDDAEAHVLKENHYKIEEIDGFSKTLQADLIQETNGGIVVKDSTHLQVILSQFWKEFDATGTISCESSDVDKLSRKSQVKKLAEIIKNLE